VIGGRRFPGLQVGGGPRFDSGYVLFGDHDVLMLVNPALDGIKDSDISGSANLHPRDWVKRFP
jgi:hypothetical protein